MITEPRALAPATDLTVTHESGCTLRLQRLYDFTRDDYRYVITIDGGEPVAHTVEELFKEFPELEGIPHELMHVSLAILRRHVASDVHADMSYVEMAAR